MARGSIGWRSNHGLAAEPGERAGSDSEICAILLLFYGFHEPWLFPHAEGAALALQRAGFVEVETATEAAPTVLENVEQYSEFVRNMILRRHLESLPSEGLRAGLMAQLTEQAAADDPPFSLDYWRLNLRGRAA
jgi:hypothetical protein